MLDFPEAGSRGILCLPVPYRVPSWFKSVMEVAAFTAANISKESLTLL